MKRTIEQIVSLLFIKGIEEESQSYLLIIYYIRLNILG